jgi:hypothetical protein
VTCKNTAVAAGDVAVLHSHEGLANVHGTFARRQRDNHAAAAQIYKAAIEGK